MTCEEWSEQKEKERKKTRKKLNEDKQQTLRLALPVGFFNCFYIRKNLFGIAKIIQMLTFYFENILWPSLEPMKIQRILLTQNIYNRLVTLAEVYISCSKTN